jgi:cytochrome c556
MSVRVWKVLASSGIAIAIGATVAWAGAADDAIKGRQDCMKAHGATMKVLGPMAKGEAAFDAAAIQAALANEEAACANWSQWWGEDTQKGETVETYAKPEIWTDPAGWEAAGNAWYQAYTAVKAAADEAAFKAAFPALGASCGGCHEKFRRPKE